MCAMPTADSSHRSKGETTAPSAQSDSERGAVLREASISGRDAFGILACPTSSQLLRHPILDLGSAKVRLAPPNSVDEILEAGDRSRPVRKRCEQAATTLPEGLASRASRFFSEKISRPHVLITRGVRDGLRRLIRSHERIERGVVTMSPCFPGYHDDVFHKSGISNINVPLITNGELHRFNLPRLQQLLAPPPRSGASKHQPTGVGAVIVTTPNTPTNLYPDQRDLQALHGMCRKHDGVLIIDDTFDNDDQNGAWIPPKLSLASTIVVGSIHEPYSLSQYDIEVGYLVAAPTIIAKLIEEERQRDSVTVPPDPKAIACAYAAMFESDNYLEERRNTMRARHAYADIRLKGLPHVIHTSGSAGTTKWITFASQQRAADVVLKLERDGIIVKPGAEYGSPESIRLSMASLRDDREFMDAMDRVATSLEDAA